MPVDWPWCWSIPAPTRINADIHAVPTIHVDDIAGAAIKAYVARSQPDRVAVARSSGRRSDSSVGRSVLIEGTEPGEWGQLEA